MREGCGDKQGHGRRSGARVYLGVEARRRRRVLRVLDLLLYYLLGWAKARFAPSAMRLAAQSNRSEKIDTGVVTKEKGSALVAL
jgi:hypothetical protein